ncbi:TatD related DNase [Weissella viridescens]|uniref:TatD related DNase n=1 Tax=Weissella viridescens TaxID=1629 RepID=A0A380P9S4_WEIVI|nr:TatD related DNase [Weissella viridescens]
MAILRDQLNDDTVVGLGEMGLDYHWEDNPAPEVQKQLLRHNWTWPVKHICQ